MKKAISRYAAFLILAALLVCTTGCAGQDGGQGGLETPERSSAPPPSDAGAAPSASPQALAQAEQFVSLEKLRLLAEKNDPWADLAYEGKPEHVMLVKPGGVIVDLVLQPYQDGQTLAQAAERGDADAALESVRVLWEGEAYSCLHATLKDAAIPGLTTDGGGILWLEISGDCAMDTGSVDYDCISGFSSVYITGSGTLTLSGGEGSVGGGGEALPLPALVIDGPEISGGHFDLKENEAASSTVPTLLLNDGGLSAKELRLPQNGALCVLGGTLKLDMLSEGGGAAMVFRGGKAEIEELAFLNDTALLTVTGGELSLAKDSISTQSVVVTGGSLTAPQLSEKPGLVLLGGEAVTADDGRPYDLGSPSDWMEPEELAHVLPYKQDVSICDTALVAWTVAVQGDLAPIHAWAGLALELAEPAAIQCEADDSALGATAICLFGPGTLTLSGSGTGIGMWAWGDMPAPYFELRGGTLVIECAGESLSMGSESGGRGLALLSGGSLTASSDLWLQNSDMVISGCAVKTKTVLAMEQGDLSVSGGSLEADSLYLGGGSLIVTGGLIDLGSGGLDVHGDIRITGGILRLPGGLDALNAQGNVQIQGGTVEDSSLSK